MLHYLLSTLLLPVYLGNAVDPATNQTAFLRDIAKPRFFGTAANTTFLYNDKIYTNLAQTEFSMFTPENELKWESIEPYPNTFNFGPVDDIVEFAQSVNATVRGHTFMWASQLAPWVNTSLSSTELDAALENHITTILKHYQGKIYSYDVINEMFSDTPDRVLKNNIWTQKLGDDALPKALRYARAADPSTKLYINEYGAEGINNKSDALYRTVKQYLEDGVPLDGIGFQAHFYLGTVPATIQQNLQRFADLGLDVAITEVDINMRGPGNATALAQQAKDYHAIVSACVAVERCIGITTWGIMDNHSWLPNGHVLPWDAAGEPKPCYYAIVDALQGK